MPKVSPRKGEKKKDFVSRCIEKESEHNKKKSKKNKMGREQIQAMCYDLWNRKKKSSYSRPMGRETKKRLSQSRTEHMAL
jgi:hypothetical protein